ncbi:hypothetical protein K6Y31_08180 [Motilimonas cestriensis]|uniref:Uncharacterized protein n=1 Tax=Motilimonas cestriensis TaxID=2742685 RepID=A0ABS8W8F8_9GAMM|nr:hypothetical protein [Motilimonas cestriensis]MCE2594793.1 hypothetical protein [Motilimonas cestriensis]
MKSRCFYLPSEISNVTSLLAGDLLDAVARENLTLCAWVEDRNLGLIGKGKLLLGTFDYCGCIGLNAEQSKQLLCYNKKVQLESFMVLEPELITGIDDCRSQFSHLNSTQFSGVDYQPKVPKQPFLATPSVAEISDFTRGNQTAFNQMKAAQEAGDHSGAFNSFLNAFTPKETKLGYVSLTIKPDQLRFDIRDIEHVFGSECLNAEVLRNLGLSTDNKPAQALSKEPRIEINEIKIIISRIIKAYPNLGSRAVWNLLRKDVMLDDPIYDTDDVIRVMSGDSISWFGLSQDSVREMTYKTFQNYVYVVKNGLKKIPN